MLSPPWVHQLQITTFLQYVGQDFTFCVHTSLFLAWESRKASNYQAIGFFPLNTLSGFFSPNQFVHALQRVKSRESGESVHASVNRFDGRDRGLWKAWDLGASLTDSTELHVCPLVEAERLLGVGHNSACKHSQCLCVSCLLVMETLSRNWPAVLLHFQGIGITIQGHAVNISV